MSFHSRPASRLISSLHGPVAIDPDGRIQVPDIGQESFGVRRPVSEMFAVAGGTHPYQPLSTSVVEFGGKGDGIDLPIAYFLPSVRDGPVKIGDDIRRRTNRRVIPAHPTVITVRAASARWPHRRAQAARRYTPAAPTARLNPTFVARHLALRGGQYRIDNADIEYLQNLH